jgi:hypothetical protein
MQNENLLGLLTAPTPVGSGVLLGIVVIGNTIVIILCLRAAVEFGAILKKHDDDLDNRKNGNGDGENVKPASEPSKLDCLLHEPRRLLLKFVGGLGRLIGKSDKQARKLDGNLDLTLWRTIANLWTKILYLIKNGVGFLIHKKRTMPNVES